MSVPELVLQSKSLGIQGACHLWGEEGGVLLYFERRRGKGGFLLILFTNDAEFAGAVNIIKTTRDIHHTHTQILRERKAREQELAGGKGRGVFFFAAY